MFVIENETQRDADGSESEKDLTQTALYQRKPLKIRINFKSKFKSKLIKICQHANNFGLTFLKLHIRIYCQETLETLENVDKP